MFARRLLRGRALAIALPAAIVTVGVSVVAVAAIPGSDGKISGCYEKNLGILRVIDAQAGKTCTRFETPISWNQTGPKGETGATGPAGPKGDTGAAGADGAPGATGEKGEKGDSGAAGADGAPGAQGEKGETGATGATGPQGPQGDTGAAGADGAPGATNITIVRNPQTGFTVSTLSTFILNVGCPPNTKVTGGGAEAQNFGFPVDVSRPNSTATGWQARAANTPLAVYAVCAAT